MKRIFVSKAALAKHPRFEQFRKVVYAKNEIAQIHDVLNETDAYQLAVFTIETEYMDALINRSFCLDDTEVSPEEFMSAVIPNFTKSAPRKRKKGPSRKSPSVNKAVILFMSGETYTVKGFVSLEATAEKTVFIVEDTWKDTVNTRNAITIYNEDVAEVKVRGIKHQFVLDMSLNNLMVLQSPGMEIFVSELSITV